MIRPELEALLQGALDNTLTPDEQARLARMLSESREARERAAEFEQLAGLIESLGPADAPAGPRRRRSRAGFASPPCNSSRQLSNEVSTVNKKILFGLAAAAAIVLAVITYNSNPPRDRRDGSDHRRRPARAGAADRRQGRQARRHQRAGHAADRDVRRDHEGRDAADHAAGRRAPRRSCRAPSCAARS